MGMDLSLTRCDAVKAKASHSYMDVEIIDADREEVLNHFENSDLLDHAGLESVIEYWGEEDILAVIGRQAAIEYFDIKEKE